MPIYEYRCTECAQTEELIQGVNDPAATECSSCGGTLEKLFSAPSFQFKGSGWYVTDYGARADSGESKEPQSTDKGSEASTAENNAESTEATSATE